MDKYTSFLNFIYSFFFSVLFRADISGKFRVLYQNKQTKNKQNAPNTHTQNPNQKPNQNQKTTKQTIKQWYMSFKSIKITCIGSVPLVKKKDHDV